MPTSKPTKLQTKGLGLKTHKCSSLPSELSRSPLPGTPADFIKQEESMKTPITPPAAYTDFLRALSSPGTGGSSGKPSPTSQPSSATSSCSCHCDNHQSPSSVYPPTPHAYPLSAPATSRRLRIPPSPLCSPGATESPMSASSIRSPFSFTRSPQEWENDGKAKYFDAPHTGNRVCVRHVVTRTVTYTTRSCPRMNLAPAPKGKRRRLD